MVAKYRKGDIVKFTFNEKIKIGTIMSTYVELINETKVNNAGAIFMYEIKVFYDKSDPLIVNPETCRVCENNIIEQL